MESSEYSTFCFSSIAQLSGANIPPLLVRLGSFHDLSVVVVVDKSLDFLWLVRVVGVQGTT